MFGLTDQEMHLAIDVLVKMGIGLVLAAAIGVEREIHGRPAGIRTHMLLMIGVVLFTIAGTFFVKADTARVAAQVVVGVGFLGAGTIMRTGAEVKGLTTAASLWATSGIGMAVAIGGPFMLVAIAATVLSLITLAGVDILEYRFLHTKRTQTLRLKLDAKESMFNLLEAISANNEVQIRSFSLVQGAPEIIVDVEVRGKTTGLIDRISETKGILAVSWQMP